MQSFILILVSIDVWVLVSIVWFISWCADWLSLSQKHLEQFLLAAWTISAILQYERTDRWWYNVMMVVIGISLWCAHRNPYAVRMSTAFTPGRFICRMFCYQMTITFASLLLYALFLDHSIHTRARIFFTVQEILYFVITVFTMVGFDGPRGKKRKESISKIKEMFGSSWIVSPLPQMR